MGEFVPDGDTSVLDEGRSKFGSGSGVSKICRLPGWVTVEGGIFLVESSRSIFALV